MKMIELLEEKSLPLPIRLALLKKEKGAEVIVTWIQLDYGVNQIRRERGRLARAHWGALEKNGRRPILVGIEAAPGMTQYAVVDEKRFDDITFRPLGNNRYVLHLRWALGDQLTEETHLSEGHGDLLIRIIRKRLEAGDEIGWYSAKLGKMLFWSKDDISVVSDRRTRPTSDDGAVVTERGWGLYVWDTQKAQPAGSSNWGKYTHFFIPEDGSGVDMEKGTGNRWILRATDETNRYT